MGNKHSLLVDMDGTLVFTADANFAAYSLALAEVGIKLSKVEFDNMVNGKNWKQFLPSLLSAHNVKVLPQQIASKKTLIYAGMMDRIFVNTALVKLLECSRQLFHTALVTNASSVNVHNILAYHSLSHLFDVVVTGDDVTKHKPDPESYRMAAERLGVSSSDCIVFEDAELGIASAKAFGAEVVVVKMNGLDPFASYIK
jgi:beta-phosphoglucomutase-like phosphatase (HAD superfamily)